jgi:8-oxo-dGTP pyrophosphatase MutT (NUDIX family)
MDLTIKILNRRSGSPIKKRKWGGGNAMSETERTEKEADHHPYRRPVDAATLILVDRTASTPKVLVGKRHDKVVFMPGKFVFPGGRVDKTDNRVPVAAPIPIALEKNLLKGSPKITASRARSLAIAAIREACEETGLCLGRKSSNGAAPTLEGAWKPFAEAGLLPDPSGLFLIARAITPPGRVRRFDTRFFTADASTIAHRVDGVIHADAELVELVWVEIGSKPLADLHPMTRNVLGELEKRLASGPLNHDAPVPFFHFYGGKMQKDVLGA